MLVFIDESGCSGFKLARGSDAVFAIGMVVFENRECALRTDRCIASFRERRGYVREFKFSKSGNRLRDEFFETVRGCPFRVRALIVEKANVQDAVLRSDDGAFYDYFMGRLVQRAAPTLRRAHLNVDGWGDKHFQRALKLHLRRVADEAVADVRMIDSRRSNLMQLADMCIGAVAREFRHGSARDEPWFRALRPHVDDVWEFVPVSQKTEAPRTRGF
jgi:hypothetical protein